MKGLPIKFRAKDCITDEYILGDVIHKDKGVYIGAMTAEGYAMSEVYPDSVAQLCGYDANGKEIYEGDAIEFLGDNGVVLSKGTARLGFCFQREGEPDCDWAKFVRLIT